MSPMVISRFVSAGQPLSTAQCEARYRVACYQAAQLQAAYDLGPLFRRGITGTGQTIVIVDPYGSPTITGDLATYDARYGLPAPPSFTVIRPGRPGPALPGELRLRGLGG